MHGLVALVIATVFLGGTGFLGATGSASAQDVGEGSTGLSVTSVDPLLLSPDAVAHTTATLPLPEILQARGATPEAQDDADARYAAEVRTRSELGAIHRALGITTWAAMTLTVVLGFFQYYNLYGIGAGINDSLCVTGQGVIFGQDQCYGTPWPHLVGGVATAVLYSATFAISLALPDPNHVSEGRGQYAERIRIHQVLRWVHLAGMVLQMGMGIMLANGTFGDRTNDYGTLQAVAATHQVIGWVTWGAMTAAGAIMLF